MPPTASMGDFPLRVLPVHATLPGMESTFGPTVRAQRKRLDIGLRAFAADVGMCPTYLSRVERNKVPPPTDGVVFRIARALNIDPDVLLARAGRVASDVMSVVLAHPQSVPYLIRGCARLTDDEIMALANHHVAEHADALSAGKEPQ